VIEFLPSVAGLDRIFFAALHCARTVLIKRRTHFLKYGGKLQKGTILKKMAGNCKQVGY
jgi:hypothetical protein